MSATTIALLALTNLAHGQSTSSDYSNPYPLSAAGWGPEVGNGLFFSRWAEDWRGLRATGEAPRLKAMPLCGDATLTLSAEARLRYDSYHNTQLIRDADAQQTLFRGIVGADLHLNSEFRVYGEVGTGKAEGRDRPATANFQNHASLQQLFVDVRSQIDSALIGAMIGRQEFADGPRQLLSLSDGPNLHRTWNGTRLYAHGERWRLGAFDLRATRLESGIFDEEIDDAERLQGLNASFVISTGAKISNIYLDTFWIHSESPAVRSGAREGRDERDTYGLRLWGKRGDLKFDWTLARQTGDSIGHDVDAWALFAVQSLALSDAGWKPRLTSHLDIASGRGAFGSGPTKGFNQLFASSNYLGEGRFLSSSNLLLFAPGIAVSPTQTTNLSVEYGFARRLAEDDAAYAGGMRPYSGTQFVSGHEIGGLLRVTASWAATEHLTLFFNFEHFAAGDVLKRTQLNSGSYAYIGATFRF
ncbi:MAG: alginate export family protein [Verrucomicrobiaceae bacterium]|nr:alginate export family protein [Verrucomicrobiaceae bacterium]